MHIAAMHMQPHAELLIHPTHNSMNFLAEYYEFLLFHANHSSTLSCEVLLFNVINMLSSCSNVFVVDN